MTVIIMVTVVIMIVEIMVISIVIVQGLSFRFRVWGSEAGVCGLAFRELYPGCFIASTDTKARSLQITPKP